MGLGVYFGGKWWTLSPKDSNLIDLNVSIPCLEMLAAAINMIVAQPFVDGTSIVLYTDSSTTADVLQRDSAHAALMQHTVEKLRATREYQRKVIDFVPQDRTVPRERDL